jgi:superfamily II DNA or RNA helicase/HKD family nuclease
MRIDTQNRVDYRIIEFERSLKSTFIQSEDEADEQYAPHIISNDEETRSTVLSVLKRELSDCDSFALSVAFITEGGIQILVKILQDLAERNIPGKILTSTYLDFNSPEALAKLLEYPNIETRVYEGDLHAKGYLFNRADISTILVGSSNLTQKALTCNQEWNVLMRSFSGGKILEQTKAEFDKLWGSKNSVALTHEWVDRYRSYYQETRFSTLSTVTLPPNETFEGKVSPSFDRTPASSSNIVPNDMQVKALQALSVLHEAEVPRALLVSATGTGKTILSALDVLSQKPRHILFIAHRKRILEASLESYKQVLGGAYTYDYLTGLLQEESTCVFAMVETLRRNMSGIDPSAFDYIVIDEAHRAGAHGYREILDYFKPRFCLGMTATPTRTDGYDVYQLFNHEIAYRITLQDALASNMLAPFHYFGIADLALDEVEQDDYALFSKLVSSERVNHIVTMIERYSVQKTERRGLIFCSRNDEAEELSVLFNERGYRTRAISGKTSDEGRNRAIHELEQGKLQYLFSVDIMNEGVDIPSLNQIIMLRKTESAVVFVQQLGRGLRKFPRKESTLVLDFIGNYQQNYLIPIALSGDRSYNKDNLRRAVKEGDTLIPGCSTINFDKVSEKRIFKALETAKFDGMKLLREEYAHLQQLLGRTPSLVDFDKNEAIDPLLIIRKSGSYAAFLRSMGNEEAQALTDIYLDLLKFLSQKFASGKRGSDIKVLKLAFQKALNNQTGQREELTAENIAVLGYAACEIKATVNALTGEFFTGKNLAPLTADWEAGAVAPTLKFTPRFIEALNNPFFKQQVEELIDFAEARHAARYAYTYKDTDFVLWEKYTREDVARLLRWEKQPNNQNVGGYFHDKQTNTMPVFINYRKDETYSETTRYEDRFVSEQRLIALSKSKRTLASPEITKLAQADTNGMKCYLFMRKDNKEDDRDGFVFLGEIHPTGRFEQVTYAEGKGTAVEIEYDLETPVREDLYDFFLSSV